MSNGDDRTFEGNMTGGSQNRSMENQAEYCPVCRTLRVFDNPFCTECGYSFLQATDNMTRFVYDEDGALTDGLDFAEGDTPVRSPVDGVRTDTVRVQGAMPVAPAPLGTNAINAAYGPRTDQTNNMHGRTKPRWVVPVVLALAAALVTVLVLATRVIPNLIGGSASQETFTVTYETNGGSAIDSETFDSGALLTSPPDPRKDGYEFAGWYADSALQEEASFPIEMDEDVILYAKWEKAKEPEPDPIVLHYNYTSPDGFIHVRSEATFYSDGLYNIYDDSVDLNWYGVRKSGLSGDKRYHPWLYVNVAGTDIWGWVFEQYVS